MKLSNYQYDVLMQRFDNKRMHARYELDKRIAEVYEKLPEIKEIDSCIASVSVNAGKSALMGDDSALLKLNENIKQLSDEKKRLLTENGYTPDYLEEHFECPKCKDTGFIGNEPCECFKVAETELILESSNIKDVLSKENFATFNAELYSNELIRLQKENILLRQKINEVFYAYQETYKAYINLKEENERLKLNLKNKDIKSDLNIESNININITNHEKIKLSDFVIENVGTTQNIQKQVNDIINKL